MQMCIRDRGLCGLAGAEGIAKEDLKVGFIYGSSIGDEGYTLSLIHICTPFFMGVGNIVLIEHGHQTSLTGGGLIITGRYDIEEGIAFQYVQNVIVPLAAYEKRCGEQVGVFDIQMEGCHAAHGLTGRVQPVGINRPCVTQMMNQIDRCINLRRSVEIIIHNRFCENRN